MLLEVKIVLTKSFSVCTIIIFVVAAACAQTVPPNTLFRIVQDEKVGFMSRTGKVIVPPRFPTTGDFREGFADVYTNEHDGKFIDTSGKFLPSPEFDFTWGFKERLAGVEIKGKWGFIDTRGKIAIAPKFIDAGSFTDGLAPAAISEKGTIKFGFINTKGKFVISPQFVYALDFIDGLAPVILEGTYSPWEANLRLVDGKYGFVDRTGKLVIKPQFADVCGISEGLICVSLNDGHDSKYGFIRSDGSVAIKPQFKTAKYFSEGLSAVESNEGKWGFIDRNGKLIISHQFEDAYSFADGLAAVEIEEKWGYIDKTGKIIIKPVFDFTYGFKDGLATVLMDNTFSWIDTTGKYFWQPKPAKTDYPAVWFAPINDPNKPDWEILPQEAKAGEVILSKRNELGILSNFAATPFEINGNPYASVEGFWQSMLYPEICPDCEPDPRLISKKVTFKYYRFQVEKMTGFEAKAAGTLAEENMKTLGIDWCTFEGNRFPYRSAVPGEHYRIIVAAMRAKANQNPEVKRILLATGDLILKPDHHGEENSPPEWKYYDIWMQIRSEMRSESRL